MASEVASKRARLTGPLIGTHSGHFHADEALAVYMLRLLPTYRDSPLVRTRDSAKLAECHTVVDVGGVYDEAARRFDHHQREFNVTFPGHMTKLSSAGLVFKDLGKAIISATTGLSEDSLDTQTLYQKLYDDFIEAFDANDNGVNKYDSAKLSDLGLLPRFNDRGYSIASVVNRFNYFSGDPSTAGSGSVAQTPEEEQQQEDERFSQASAFTGQQFIAELMDTFRTWLPARSIVKQVFNSRTDIDAQGRIIVLPHRKEGLPWQDHLYSFEEEESSAGSVIYALFPEGGAPDSKWRIRAVSLNAGSFESRKALPEAWRGLRDETLDGVTGISGCVFVHAAGFIGGNKTYEGALSMARKALEIA